MFFLTNVRLSILKVAKQGSDGLWSSQRCLACAEGQGRGEEARHMKGFVIKDACAGLSVCVCACVRANVTQNYRLGKSAACLLTTLPDAEPTLFV